MTMVRRKRRCRKVIRRDIRLHAEQNDQVRPSAHAVTPRACSKQGEHHERQPGSEASRRRDRVAQALGRCLLLEISQVAAARTISNQREVLCFSCVNHRN